MNNPSKAKWKTDSQDLKSLCGKSLQAFYNLAIRGEKMPRGDKSKYTDKQKRQAEHIEESYEKKDVSKDEAEKRAWSTINKQDGGGNKSGSGRKTSGSSKSEKDAPDRDSSATKGGAGTRPPSDS